jgi:hypothetical protein
MELHAAYGQCLHRLRIASRHIGFQATEEDLARIAAAQGKGSGANGGVD